MIWILVSVPLKSAVTIISLAEYLNEGLDIIEPHMDSLTDCSRCRELCECIYWRKGALLYMYCHTSYNNQSNQMSEEGRKEQFLNYALDGKSCSIYIYKEHIYSI